jgi:hypothetical protein
VVVVPVPVAPPEPPEAPVVALVDVAGEEELEQAAAARRASVGSKTIRENMG